MMVDTSMLHAAIGSMTHLLQCLGGRVLSHYAVSLIYKHAGFEHAVIHEFPEACKPRMM